MNLLELVATRPAIAPQGGTTHLRLTVSPRENHVREVVERPIALILLADRSGSMGDRAGAADVPVAAPSGLRRLFAPPSGPHHGEQRSKMSVLRDAAERLIDAMRDVDRFGLVTFSDVAQRDLALATLGGGHRTESRAAIRALRPDASTNLHDGLRLAIAQFDAETLRTHVCKILVITDGLANVGVSSPDGLASAVVPAAQAGVTVSAIGVGLEYNSAVLGAIARAGAGDYYYLENAAGIDALFQRELQATAAVQLRGVELFVSAGMAAIGANLNGYTQFPTAEGVRILLGDLARSRAVWIELTSPVPLAGPVVVQAGVSAVAADDVPETAEATLTLRVTSDVASVAEDSALVRELADLLQAQGIGETAELLDSGDLAAGQQRAQSQLHQIRGLSAVYSGIAAMPEDATLQALATPSPAAAVDRRRMKSLAATSNAKRRGQPPEEQ